MPPIAAAMGSMAFLNDDRSPISISRLISSPTTKKKITINPSLIQCSRDFDIDIEPKPKETSVCQNCSYECDHAELDQTSAIVAQANRRIPEAA